MGVQSNFNTFSTGSEGLRVLWLQIQGDHHWIFGRFRDVMFRYPKVSMYRQMGFESSGLLLLLLGVWWVTDCMLNMGGLHRPRRKGAGSCIQVSPGLLTSNKRPTLGACQGFGAF